MYYLIHRREQQFISCKSFDDMIKQYFMQWRDNDGTIPWRLFYENSTTIFEINTKGEIIKEIK